jgi:hypothetical protein
MGLIVAGLLKSNPKHNANIFRIDKANIINISIN